MSGKAAMGTVKAPLGSYPKLWRLIDHYFLKDDPPDRDNVSALELICTANAAVLANEKSVNARTLRGKEVQLVVSTGCVAVLIECGWLYRVQRMEECYVLPYDADLDALRAQQAKLEETQAKVQERFVAAERAIKQRKKTEDAEKMRIVRQIDGDRADRQYKQALRSGVVPAPTPAASQQKQSLDDARRQAVQERLEREKARKAKLAADAAAAEPTSTDAQSVEEQAGSLPGSFPTGPEPHIDSPPRRGGPTGGRSVRAQRNRQRHRSSLPSETNRLGGALQEVDAPYDADDAGYEDEQMEDEQEEDD